MNQDEMMKEFSNLAYGNPLIAMYVGKVQKKEMGINQAVIEALKSTTKHVRELQSDLAVANARNGC